MTAHDKTQPIWLFMAATAMATTISTLAATAIVKADSAEPVTVDCACQTAEPVCQKQPTTAPVATPEAPTPGEVAPRATPAAAPEPAPAPSRATAKDSTPRAQLASMGVEGGLDKDIIRRIVRAHINEIRYCYNEGLAEDPTLAGRVVIKMTIDGSKGTVTESEVASTTLEDSDVPECIAKATTRWKFPKSADGNKVVVSYPFVLEPGD